MTPRTLFNIILKILGIFFIKDFLAIIPQLLSVAEYFTKPETVNEAIWIFILTLLMLFVYGLVSYFLVFKTELIIDKLKLDKGFNQEIIPINIHRSTILSISIIIIGGLLVTNEIPNFCRELFSYFQEKRMTYGHADPKISYSIVSGTKIIIGMFLMTGQKQIVNLVERQRKR
jgi:hypothetical protein